MKNLSIIISIILLVTLIYIYDSYNDSKKYIELKDEQVTCLENSIKDYIKGYDYCVNNSDGKYSEFEFSTCIHDEISYRQQAIEYCQDNFN